METSDDLVKTFRTLCVSGEENVIQSFPPPPLNSVGLTSQTPFTYLANVKDLNFVRGGGGGGGKVLLRPCL